jgi:hypothetical protein
MTSDKQSDQSTQLQVLKLAKAIIDKCIQDGIYIDIARLLVLPIFSDDVKEVLRRHYDDTTNEKRREQFIAEATKFMLGESSIGKVINAVNGVNAQPVSNDALSQLKKPLLGMDMAELEKRIAFEEKRIAFDAQMEDYAKRWAR